MKYLTLIWIGIVLEGALAQDVKPTEANATSGPVPAVNTGEELDNDAFIKSFEEAGYTIACDWMNLVDPTRIKLNLNREMSYEDATKLTFLVKGRKLHKHFIGLEQDIMWKRKIINRIWNIYESACPSVLVQHEYMNIMRELAIVYLNSVQPRMSPDIPVWNSILDSLAECGRKGLPSHNFTSAGLMISKLIIPETSPSTRAAGDDDDTVDVEGGDGDNNGGAGGEGEGGGVDENDSNLMDLSPQIDNAQLVFNLDIIIDNLWQVFSHAWARCLPTASSRDLWGPRFKQLFLRDILAPLEQRWANPGKEMRSFMDLIVGDYDVARMQANIPYCTQAAYINPKGTHLASQLIRPIKLTEIERGVSKFQNSRVS